MIAWASCCSLVRAACLASVLASWVSTLPYSAASRSSSFCRDWLDAPKALWTGSTAIRSETTPSDATRRWSLDGLAVGRIRCKVCHRAAQKETPSAVISRSSGHRRKDRPIEDIMDERLFLGRGGAG